MAGIFEALFKDITAPAKKAKDILMETNTACAIKNTLQQMKEESVDKKIDKKVEERVIEIKAENLAKKKTAKLTKEDAS